MNLNETISKIRVELQNSNIKKSGLNKHAGFSYYELSDFLPLLNTLHQEHGVNDQITFKDGLATLILRKGDDSQEYSIPFQMFSVPVSKSGNPMMQEIQYLGALNTYYKRYLYLNAYGITDGEVIDSMDNSKISKPNLTAEKIDEVVKFLTTGGKWELIEKKYIVSESMKSDIMDLVDNG